MTHTNENQYRQSLLIRKVIFLQEFIWRNFVIRIAVPRKNFIIGSLNDKREEKLSIVLREKTHISIGNISYYAVSTGYPICYEDTNKFLIFLGKAIKSCIRCALDQSIRRSNWETLQFFLPFPFTSFRFCSEGLF
jgi:hypothetical protein